MIEHVVKSWPEFFAPVLEGAKNFELRRNDRRYKAGDFIVLQEWDGRQGKYTGRECKRVITYVLEGGGVGAIPPLHGLARDYCILGLTAI